MTRYEDLSALRTALQLVDDLEARAAHAAAAAADAKARIADLKTKEASLADERRTAEKTLAASTDALAKLGKSQKTLAAERSFAETAFATATKEAISFASNRAEAQGRVAAIRDRLAQLKSAVAMNSTPTLKTERSRK